MPASYYALPDEDSLSVTKRVPYVLHMLPRLFSLPSVTLVAICSHSEYNLNYLLSFLLENKSEMDVQNLHILCLTETNIHREIRSRLRFLREAERNPSVRAVVIVNDNLLPLFRDVSFHALIHFDLPLSKTSFFQRQSCLAVTTNTPLCHTFLVTSNQIQSIRLLYANQEHLLSTVEDFGDVSVEKRMGEQFAKKKKELRDGVMDAQEINIDQLTPEQEHALFYQNEKSEIVKPDEKEYVELDLNDLDAGDLDDIDAQLESVERPPQQRCVPMIPTDLSHSVFNPFFNPGVMHCFSKSYSPFCRVCLPLFF